MTFNLDMNNHSAVKLSDIPKSSVDWLNDRKQSAINEFCSLPFPTRKFEHFKYNDLTFLKETTLTLGKETAEGSESFSSIELEDAIEILVVDGKIVTDLSELQLETGLTIKKLSDCTDSERSLVVNRLTPNKKNLFLNLNLAILDDGVFISVDSSKQIKKPIYFKNFTSSNGTGNVHPNFVFVHAGTSSDISLIEHFETEASDSPILNLQQSYFDLADNSNINLYRLNLEQESAYQVSQVKTYLGRDANFDSFYLGLGSKLNRTDIDILHQGQNAHCELTGVYLPANDQAIDYHTNIEHQVPHCTSNEIFRGIIADKAAATFNGKIHIFKDAQKSDAFLNNKNLLLTNQAEINTKPELEIYADDVKCAHGATVAQLDDKSVYYLQTRGIERKKARKMLSIAFIQELIETIKIEPVKLFVKSRLDNYMSHLDKN